MIFRKECVPGNYISHLMCQGREQEGMSANIEHTPTTVTPSLLPGHVYGHATAISKKTFDSRKIASFLSRISIVLTHLFMLYSVTAVA